MTVYFTCAVARLCVHDRCPAESLLAAAAVQHHLSALRKLRSWYNDLFEHLRHGNIVIWLNSYSLFTLPCHYAPPHMT